MARKASLALAVGIMLAAAYAVFAAKGWQWKAALFPLAIGIPLFFLAAIEVAWTLAAREAPEEPAPSSALPWAWMVAFLALIVLLGFPIAVAIFVLVYLKVQAKEGWLFSIVLTAAVWGAFYGLFDLMLHLPFPAGWLLEWLGFAA
jgi:cytochrome b561